MTSKIIELALPTTRMRSHKGGYDDGNRPLSRLIRPARKRGGEQWAIICVSVLNTLSIFVRRLSFDSSKDELEQTKRVMKEVEKLHDILRERRLKQAELKKKSNNQ